MAGPLIEFLSHDFSGGIFREAEPQSAPENTVYDIVNGLLDDQGSVYRRGGSVYHSTSNAPVAISGTWDGALYAGPRTIAWGSGLVALDASDVAFTSVLDST